MGRNYFRLLYVVYAFAFVICVTTQTTLKLRFTDEATGFYVSSGWIVGVWQFVLAAAVVMWFVLTFLHRANYDYPVSRRGGVSSVLSILCGLSIGIYNSGELFENVLVETPSTTPGISSAVPAVAWISLVLGIASVLSMIWTGINGLLGKSSGVLMHLCPAVWQIFVLLTSFNGYKPITTISDSILIVLFMVFATLFFLGRARVLSGLGRSDGRNYIIPSGLSVSLVGFALGIPNMIWIATHDETLFAFSPGALYLSYILLLSIYALCFTISFTRSIKTV